MNLNFKHLDTIPKLISFFTVIFLLGALWYEGLHFNFFGIDIFSYINLTDAIILFIQKLFLMVGLSLIAFLFFYMFQSVFENSLKKMFDTTKYNMRFRLKQFKKGLIVMFFITLIPMISFMVFLPTWNSNLIKNEGFIYLRAFFVLLNLYFYFNWSLSYANISNEKSYVLQKYSIATVILSFFVIIYYYHRVEILNITNFKHNRLQVEYRVKLKKNNEVIDCIDSAYFVGKTKEYLFVTYPNQNGEYTKTRVISMNDVEEINTYKIIGWNSVFP
jgi:hypothetical protein